MAIGIVSDTEFEDELIKSTKRGVTRPSGHVTEVMTPEVREIPTRGRNDGDVNVPDSLRKIIGETAVIEGRQAALGLAKEFGISPSSVSAYAKGATSTTTYHEPKPAIIDHINKSRHRAIKRASKTLHQALSSISQDKLDMADAKDLAGVAKDMSVIIKNLEPPQPTIDPSTNNNQPQFVIFAPQFRDERSFEVIQVQE